MTLLSPSEVSDLQLTSGQVNQLRVGMRLFMSPIEVSNLWAESVSREWCLCDWPIFFWNKDASKESYGGMTHDVWIAHVNGVLPSWKGVLILDNSVQIPCCDAQMKMPIFLLDSSFREVQDRSKDHLDLMSRTFILNLFKICAGRPEMKCRLEAPAVVSHTLTDGHI